MKTTRHRPNRRDALMALAVAASAFALPVAQAQGFPDKPLRLVVPFGAGTTTDIISRVVGEGMARELAQPVVVDNRAGAGGTTGSALVARGQADGYQILMGTVGTHAINATLFRSLSYDPLKDFAPIALVGYTPTFLVTSADGPIKTLADLKARAAQGQGASFASAGNGTSGHLAGELLKARLGGQMVHVPYKEGGQALGDVIAGRADFMFYHPAAVLPHMQAGRLRALGVSSAQRSAAARACTGPPARGRGSDPGEQRGRRQAAGPGRRAAPAGSRSHGRLWSRRGRQVGRAGAPVGRPGRLTKSPTTDFPPFSQTQVAQTTTDSIHHRRQA